MKKKDIRQLIEPYRVRNGKKFRLKHIKPWDTGKFTSEDKDGAQEFLSSGVDQLCKLQEKLYAQNCWALLLVFQAMDAAGKDGTIKHVMSGVNPQGCQVYSFKGPSSEELDHDYLWRTSKCIPERGRIGIFNRSYYEEVLVVKIHRDILAGQRLPTCLVHKGIWKERYKDINGFERYLTRNGVMIRKFFLHVSRKEQRKRFLERLQDPDKHWKFSVADAKERDCWDDYQDAYEQMIRHTSHKHAPWFVVPADNKWFTRMVVSAAVIDALNEMKLEFPKVDKPTRKELIEVQKVLENKGKVSSKPEEKPQ